MTFRPEDWPLMKEVFEGARALSADARPSYLATACGDDEALRQEVELLLTSHQRAKSFLETPAAVLFDEPMVTKSLEGQRIGAYQLSSQMGAGGMGEVYRARDTKLNRGVAIKVLLPAVANDPDRLARFSREAQVLASLNHPNIAQIHGLEESDGVRALVMELVEGQTLADRIAKGAIPFEEALPIAEQIALALEAAHEQGIIHRDLKPANIMVRPDGRVKVLDFGLAKAVWGTEESRDFLQLTAVTRLETGVGHIVGSPAYMSPEQARGKDVDERTDIWAFGCLLYELLTGRQAFQGEMLSDTNAAVLEREPDWNILPPKTPAKVRELLRHCLQKDTALRLDDIAVARTTIEEIQQTRRSPRAVFGMIAVGVVIIAALAGVLHFTRRAGPSPLRRYAIPLPANAPVEGALALSNDARRLVYKSSAAGPLYLRKMDTGEVTPIAGTENGDLPFFSPDGEWIGFYSAVDEAIKKVALSGGPPITIAKLPQLIRGAIWLPENSILFASPGKRFSQVSASGGTPQPLETYNPKETEGQRWPTLLPDGRHLLYTINNYSGNYESAKIAVLSLRDQTSKIVLEGGTFPRYCCGHLVYSHSGDLFAVPFDADALQIKGSPIPVADAVGGLDLIGLAYADVASDGTLVYAPRNSLAEQRELVWIDRMGATTPISAVRRNYRRLALSPDGAHLAVIADEHGRSDLWMYEFGRDLWRRLTTADSVLTVAWAPDSSRIFFSSGRSGSQDVYSMPIDGSAPARDVTRDKSNWQMPFSVSPDNRYVLVLRDQRPLRILLLDLQHPDRMERLVPSAGDQGGAAFSPDGRWFAFVSNEAGQAKVYLSKFPDAGRKWLVSDRSGYNRGFSRDMAPFWRRDGRELYYVDGKKLMAVDMSPPMIGKARVLFETDLAVAGIATDGQRFIGIRSAKVPPATQLNVITGLFDNLKTRQRRPGAK